MTRQEKLEALAQLAARRRAQDAGSKLEGYTRDYKRLEEFHDGFYDQHHWVGPWSITACNVDSDVMLVAQDWASEEFLQRQPNHTMRQHGHDPTLRTNVNVKLLLRD